MPVNLFNAIVCCQGFAGSIQVTIIQVPNPFKYNNVFVFLDYCQLEDLVRYHYCSALSVESLPDL